MRARTDAPLVPVDEDVDVVLLVKVVELVAVEVESTSSCSPPVAFVG